MVLLKVICAFCLGFGIADAVSNRTFPEGFIFATATASYQVEGAWDADGKGENIWDHLCHTNPGAVKNQDNGDVACDSYHKYKEDVQLLKDLGVDYYRFSLSWSRILPSGFTNKINEAGVQYYKNLLKELKDNGIEPLVTLYHWDLPQPLQDIGGWPNPLMADYFVDYARVCFEQFGDDVKLWTTFNEPKQTCQEGYGAALMAPLINSSGLGEYLCTHTLLKAHAKTWHLYDDEFRAKQGGRIGMVVDVDWYEPNDPDVDEEAAETRRQFTYGWYVNPIFNGNYPQVMIDRIGNRSKEEGFSKSRLPVFTDEEIDYIKGTADYFGLNTYTTFLVAKTTEPEIGDPSFQKDIGVEEWQDPSWEQTPSDWLKVVPWGMRKLLSWVKKTYNNPEIIITENGVADDGTSLEDPSRIHYYEEYLTAVLEAIYEDGVNVTGYTAWSLLDNFEWLKGYTEKFGMYHIDFESPNRERTPKASVEKWKQWIKTRCLVDKCI